MKKVKIIILVFVLMLINCISVEALTFGSDIQSIKNPLTVNQDGLYFSNLNYNSYNVSNYEQIGFMGEIENKNNIDLYLNIEIYYYDINDNLLGIDKKNLEVSANSTIYYNLHSSSIELGFTTKDIKSYKFLIVVDYDDFNNQTFDKITTDSSNIDVKKNNNLFIILMFFIPLSLFTIAFILFKTFSKKNKVIIKENYYLIDSFNNKLNSLEVSFICNGFVDYKDIFSLLLYFATNGYIKIIDGNLGADVKFLKLKEYDGNNENEKMFFDGLFQSNECVGIKDLKNTFYKTAQKININMEDEQYKKKIFNNNFKYNIRLIFLMIFSLSAIIFIPLIEYGMLSLVIGNLIYLIFFFGLCFVIYFKLLNPSSLTRGWIFILTCFLFLIHTEEVIKIYLSNYQYLCGGIVGFCCIIGIFLLMRTKKVRTMYANEIYGKILAMKNNLDLSDNSKLNLLLMHDSEYFYNILPYAYVLGLSDKCFVKIEKFCPNFPEWYENDFSNTISDLKKFINEKMQYIIEMIEMDSLDAIERDEF